MAVEEIHETVNRQYDNGKPKKKVKDIWITVIQTKISAATFNNIGRRVDKELTQDMDWFGFY